MDKLASSIVEYYAYLKAACVFTGAFGCVVYKVGQVTLRAFTGA